MAPADSITPIPIQHAAITYNADGLIPAIVQDDRSGAVLMMAWMTAETLAMSLEQRRTVFWSRSRREIWRKGDTSGDYQHIRSAYYDCDGDVLLFKVEQIGNGACHTGAFSCFHRALALPAEAPSPDAPTAEDRTAQGRTGDETNHHETGDEEDEKTVGLRR